MFISTNNRVLRGDFIDWVKESDIEIFHRFASGCYFPDAFRELPESFVEFPIGAEYLDSWLSGKLYSDMFRFTSIDDFLMFKLVWL